MTIEAQNNGTGGGEPTSTAPAGGTPAPAKNEPAPKVEPAKTKNEPAKNEPAPKAPKVISGDDDDIPDGEELLQMTPRALNSRINRASKKQLKDAFGTDDVDAIKKQIEKAKSAQAKEEEERKKSLTEAERLKEERDVALKERDEARNQLTAAERGRIVDKQDARITKVAEKYLDPDYIESEMPRLAADLRRAFKEKDPKLAKDEGKWLESWFAKRIEAKPKLGKDYDASAVKKDEPDPKKVPLNNGANAGARPNALQSGAASPKTASPGKPNSMSYKEINDLGYQWK